MDIRAHLTLIITNKQRLHDLDSHGADLSAIDLSKLCADRMDLSGADLRGAKLRKVRFNDCQLQGAKLEDTDWSDATLRMCNLDGAQSARACFDGARLEDSTATGADMSQVNLRGAHLTETSFARAMLRGARLDNAEGEGVEFRGADLTGATLIGAQFDEADFRGADLSAADLTRGRFRAADFRGAILDGARFDAADCAGARFDEGQTPNAASATRPKVKEDTSFDQIAGTALFKLLNELPEMLATRQGSAAERIDRLQRGVDMHAPPAAPASEVWMLWLQQLMTSVNGESEPDLNAVLKILRQAPGGLLPTQEGSKIDELLSRLQHTVGTFDTTTDQPPEEWKPWLEPLMKRINEGQELDGDSLLEMLSVYAQDVWPKEGNKG